MSYLEYEGEDFYLYAMRLFYEAGHVFTFIPVFSNHSPEEFIFLDNKFETSLSYEQRLLFELFNNISCLFSVNGCVFFSINLLTIKSKRSRIAHDIHTMLHPIVGFDGTICLFRYDQEVMLSFMGFGYGCILSDWYPMEDDYDHLSALIDIANFSIVKGKDYFADMVYILARSYYQYSQIPTREVHPVNFISGAGIEDIIGKELDQHIRYPLFSPQHKYGDDYVEYEDVVSSKKDNVGEEIESMLLEMDVEEDNSFCEEFDYDNNAPDDDGLFEENAKEDVKDEYMFIDIAQEIFDDPTLLIKWIDKHE